jgi:hypothetical protein
LISLIASRFDQQGGAIMLGYLGAEMRGKARKVQTLRLAILMFLESVIILDGAIARLAALRLNGQPVLFRDCSVKLDEQLQMPDALSEHFNLLARAVDAAEINLEELRNSFNQKPIAGFRSGSMSPVQQFADRFAVRSTGGCHPCR